MIIVERKIFHPGHESPDEELQDYLNTFSPDRIISVQHVSHLYLTSQDCAAGNIHSTEYLVTRRTPQ